MIPNRVNMYYSRIPGLFEQCKCGQIKTLLGSNLLSSFKVRIKIHLRPKRKEKPQITVTLYVVKETPGYLMYDLIIVY